MSDKGTAVFGLAGEVALVTGGGTGIGLATARRMAECGARVVIVGRHEDSLREACASIGEAASWYVHDVTETEAAPGLIEQIANDVGPVSVLVNNAGIHVKKRAVETSSEDFDRVLRTHLSGAFALSRAVVPGMQARGGGSILFMASMASIFGIPQVVAYATAKTGMLGMVRTLSVELGEANIRINAIAPGWIESRMSSKALEGDPVRRDKILGRTPLGRLGQADDIAWAAVYLASQAGRFITGAVLPVDGGISIGF